MKIKTILAAVAVLSALGLAAVGAGCGDDDHGDHTGGGGGANAAGNATDAAFVNDMVPHHEGAIEMARLAQKEADKEEIRNLADGIIAAQESEIATLRSVQADVGDAHGGAHMSGDEHMRGMDMDADELHGAKPLRPRVHRHDDPAPRGRRDDGERGAREGREPGAAQAGGGPDLGSEPRDRADARVARDVVRGRPWRDVPRRRPRVATSQRRNRVGGPGAGSCYGLLELSALRRA